MSTVEKVCLFFCTLLASIHIVQNLCDGSFVWAAVWSAYLWFLWAMRPRRPKHAGHLPLFRFYAGRDYARERGAIAIFAFAPWPFEEQQPGEYLRCLLCIGLYVSLSRRQISLTVYSDDPGNRPAPPVRKSSRVLMYPETAYAVTPGSWAA